MDIASASGEALVPPPVPLPTAHPLRAARWIWPETIFYLQNHFANFRHDFDLPVVPSPAPLFITADKAYKLYINGTFVCRGPARGYQSHWPFDEVDVAQYLRKGHNWISVEAYNPGISTFQYIHQTHAGLLCAAKWGKVSIASGTDWLFRRSPGHLTHTARYTVQLDFQEHFEARGRDRGWIADPTAPTGWKRCPLEGSCTLEAGFGRPPWDNVEPRGIPLMREEIVTPVKVTASATGACGDGYREWENVSFGWNAEGRKVKKWQDGSTVSSTRKKDFLEFVVEPAGKGKFRSVTLDLGEIIVANLIVEVDGAEGGEILDFQHDQCLRDGIPKFLRIGDACNLALANRLRPARGKTRHEFFHILGFRHLTLIGRDITKPLKVRVKARSARYPFTMRGSFACSDTTLNAIHAACRTTQQICALDAYVDTPWREQAQWWGDARVQALNTFYLDGDPRLLARGIRSIAGQSTTLGLTYGHAPTVAYNCILPDFSLTWILTLWDYYWQTGDITLFEDMFPRVKMVLGYFNLPETRAKDGLVRYDPRFWYFGDWGDLYRGEIPTFLNLWYLLTINKTAELARVAGLNKDADALEREAETLSRLITRKLFDRDKGLMCDGLDKARKQADSHSVYEQTLALITGIAPKAHNNMIAQRVLPYLRGEKVPGPTPSAFWCTYVLGEMGQRGYGDEVVAFIRKRWEPMLSTGTAWEGFWWKETGGSSCSHAWSAHPSFHLVNILAGIRPTAPAWEQVHIEPSFPKGVDHAQALVPSPRGDISSSWQRKGDDITLTVELPKGVKADVVLPDVTRTVSKKGTHTFSARVADDG